MFLRYLQSPIPCMVLVICLKCDMGMWAVCQPGTHNIAQQPPTYICC